MRHATANDAGFVPEETVAALDLYGKPEWTIV